MKAIKRLVMIVCAAVLDRPTLGRVRLSCQQIDTSQGVPSEIVIAPWGNVQSENGDFIIDEEGAREILRAYHDKGVDLVIDYHHQTLGGEFKAPDGKAPAAGWIRSLRAEPGRGIIAVCEWTPAGEQAVQSRSFRYLSPVVMAGIIDRRARQIHSVALTNTPAIKRMAPIVNAMLERVEFPKRIANAAGDAPTSGDDGVVGDLEAALTQIKDGTATPDSLVPTLESLITRIKSMMTSVNSFVMQDAKTQAGQRLVEDGLRRENQNLRINLLLQQHAGKVPPAKDAWFRDWYRTDPKGAGAWLVNAEPLVYSTRDAQTHGGAGPVSSDRGALIVNAKSAFRQNSDELAAAGSRMLCGMRAFVNTTLRDAGQARMTEDEQRMFRIVG